MTALADALQWERSRVSHQATRMVKRGLVQRTSCPTDGRGAFLAVTDDGMREIERAAPHHVETVRRVFLDLLDEADKRELARLLALIERSSRRATPTPRSPDRPPPRAHESEIRRPGRTLRCVNAVLMIVVVLLAGLALVAGVTGILALLGQLPGNGYLGVR